MLETLQGRLQAAIDYLDTYPYLEAAAILVGFLVLAKIVDWIFVRILERLTKQTKTDLDDKLVSLIHKPIFVTVMVIGFGIALTRLDLSAGVELALRRILKTVAILIWWVFLARAVRIVLEILGSLESKYEFIEPRTTALIDNGAKLALAGGGIYALLVTWNIEIGGFLVSAGVLGLALGLAAKDTLANLFSGIFIIADAPYQKGDFINLDSGERGMVTEIGLRSTRVLTRDDVEVTVPNAVIANAKIMNESGGPSEKHRVRVKVGVAYGSDIDQVEEVLMSIAREQSALCATPAPRVRFRSFGDSALDFELLGWIEEPVLRGRVLHALNREVYKRFNAEGIQIPFPQRDVHLYPAGASEPSMG